VGGKNFEVAGLVPTNGSEPWEVDWVFRTNREVFGTAALTPGVAYIASTDRFLYAVDRSTGEEHWRFNTEQMNLGSVALGHDGTIYSATHGNIGWLFAVSQKGDEIWRFELAGLALGPPVVAGDETIYVCSTDSVNRIGWIDAVRPDGTQLWRKQMPDEMNRSPMLAPDGTLYAMCRDKNLYAFRDVAGDLDHDGDIDLADLGSLGDCMTGPRIWGTRALTPPGCELLDFDRDWDVDVADFARIQIELSAP
jgi:outer membrane protein assembly factor BamB